MVAIPIIIVVIFCLYAIYLYGNVWRVKVKNTSGRGGYVVEVDKWWTDYGPDAIAVISPKDPNFKETMDEAKKQAQIVADTLNSKQRRKFPFL
jgi:hypothetical protein